MAGAADRCVIPEYAFSMERLAELMSQDREKNPSHYSVVLVSEGARMENEEDMSFEGAERDQYGHRKLGGMGDKVAASLRDLSVNYGKGRRVNVINQRLGYLVRSGDPDALDSIVPMAYGNLALDLVLAKKFGRLVRVQHGDYGNVDLDVVTSSKKVVDLSRFYNTDRLRPNYDTFDGKPLFIMTGGK
jgi:6-phosphofructokinase 1